MLWLERSPNEPVRLLLVTGLLGGFTTFSAFSVESLMLLQHGRLGPRIAASAGAVICAALGAAVLGWALVRAAA